MNWKLCSRVAVALCGAALCASTYGDIVLVEHSGYQEGPLGDYQVTWDLGVPSILIREASTAQLGAYDFECYDNSTSRPYDPATIGTITALPNIGNVEIKVVGHPDRTYGAVDVKLIDLSGASDSEICELRISGDVGHLGDVVADTISGVFDVSLGAVLNDIEIKELDGEITCLSMGDLTADGGGTHEGQIEITGDDGYAGRIYIEGSTVGDSKITVNNFFSGTIETTGDLAEVLLSWPSLGYHEGSIIAGGDLGTLRIMGHWMGTVDVGHDLSGMIHLPLGWALHGDISIGHDILEHGSLQISGGLRTSSEITIGNVVHGQMTVGHADIGSPTLAVLGGIASTGGLDTLGSSMAFHLETGYLAGLIEVGDDKYDHLTGSVTVLGDVTSGDQNAIHVAGHLTGHVSIDGSLRRPLEIDGDVYLDDVSSIRVGGELSSEIRVSGILDISGTRSPMYVGSMSASGAIAIDWDGWHPRDGWLGGTIQVGQTFYGGNTPEDRIYEVTGCRGDMDCDYDVDFDDVDAFVLGLDPDPTGYETAFPGLGGSRIFHGDTNCDEEFNFDDLDSFVERIGQPCDPYCPERAGGGQPLPPLQLATAMATHVAPERHAALVTLVADVADRHQDEQRAAYWRAVWEYLTE